VSHNEELGKVKLAITSYSTVYSMEIGATHSENHSASGAVKRCGPIFDHAAYVSYALQAMYVHSASRAVNAISGFEGLHWVATFLGSSSTRLRIVSQPCHVMSLAVANRMRVQSFCELLSVCSAVCWAIHF
jgi:hypothetical protein